MDFLAQLKREVCSRMVLPDARFFTPTEEFFCVLKQFENTRFIDAGCGSGQLSDEAAEWDITMLGVDLIARPGQNQNVLLIDALHMPYNNGLWPVICRPNHDGWCEDVTRKALEAGAKVLYVGLERNVEDDLDDLMFNVEAVYTDVGEEGEAMFVLSGKPLDRQALERLRYAASDGLHPCYD